MKKRSIKLLAVPVALGLVAAACGSDDDGDADEADTEESSDSASASEAADDEGDDAAGDATDFDGAEITITGPERTDQDVGSINGALEIIEERLNVNIEYLGDADWEANINTQVEGGNPPDLAIFPQPGKLADFANEGFVVPMSDDVVATTNEFWAESFQADGTVDGTLYGVPVKTDLKSLVWYQPGRFTEAGYEVPETFDDFVALVDTIAAAGDGAPLCVGVESGQATGWAFTDWVEDMVLRQHGGDVYDGWVSNEVPFNDPRIVETMETVIGLWTEENVFASGGSIASTNFGDNAIPLVDGDCWMHRQANFFAGFFPEGTTFADDSDPNTVDAFYFPDINGDRPVLTAGTFVAAFNDNPATMAVAEFMATAEYAETRQRLQTELLGGALSGFLSAAQGQDPSVYQPLEQGYIEILTTTEFSRFDGSDLMPAAVGAGTFWSEGTSLITGEIDAQTAADRIQDSWPS
ncbi:MAG: ABC transporter substrate-binding protein [Actinomycetota bacterium]